ncbi:MAG TPA: hypothetical protein VE986_07350 [Hyphomicrobiales bacterium]|nr:hypothetical protein [Hyphomicrobiales bacterium]
MILEKQVCSFALAKLLCDLGVSQHTSFFYWQPDGDGLLEYWDMKDGSVSAFSVPELGEMLPWELIVGAHRYELDLFKNGEEPAHWFVGYTTKDEPIYSVLGMNYHFGKTEADARAKMLIYLLEQQLINNSLIE